MFFPVICSFLGIPDKAPQLACERKGYSGTKMKSSCLMGGENKIRERM